jgi:hypothetical protein
MPNITIPQLVLAVVAGSLLAHVFLLLAQGQGALLQRNWDNLWRWLTGAPPRRAEGFSDVATAYATQYNDYGTWAEPPPSAPVVTADYDPTDYAAVEAMPPAPVVVPMRTAAPVMMSAMMPQVPVAPMTMMPQVPAAMPSASAASFDADMSGYGAPL